MAVKRRRRKGPPSVPKPVSEVVFDMFRWLKLGDQARSFRAMQVFAECATPQLLKNARAEALRGHVLFVRVVSATWSQQLHFMKEQLLKRLNEHPSSLGIKDLRFIVGELDAVPAFEKTPEFVPYVPEPIPTASAPDELMSAMSGVNDTELREDLARLYLRARSTPERNSRTKR